VTGILIDEPPFHLRGTVGRLRERGSRKITRLDLVEQATVFQLQRQLLEDRLHLRGDAQTFRGEADSEFRPHFAETRTKERGREIVLRGNCRLQPGTAADDEHVVERMLRRFPQPRQRHRLQWCRFRNRRRPLPIHVIKDVARAAEGIAPDARYADRSEAVDQDARFSGVVIEADPSLDELGVAFEDTGADPGRASGRAQK